MDSVQNFKLFQKCVFIFTQKDTGTIFLALLSPDQNTTLLIRTYTTLWCLLNRQPSPKNGFMMTTTSKGWRDSDNISAIKIIIMHQIGIKKCI